MTQSISTHTTRVTPLAHASKTPLYHLFQPHECIDTMLQNIRGLCSHPVIENLAKKIILTPQKELENKIKRLKEPDPSLIDQINVHEETPDALWCSLLERSQNVPKLRKWLLESIQIEWLSLPNFVGRACRNLLQNAFEETVLQKWLQTEPEPRILMNFFEDRTIRRRKLSAETLVHLTMLPIEYFASQSLTVFPWERLKSHLEDKNPKWLTPLQSNITTLQTIPHGLRDLCQKTQTIRGSQRLLDIMGGHSEDSFLLEANRLMQTLCKKSQHKWTLEKYLPSHFKAILDLKNPSTELLQGAVHLLLHPFSKPLGNAREALFRQCMQRIVALFLNREGIEESAKQVHGGLLEMTQETALRLAGPVPTAFKVPTICRISISAIIQQAQEIIEHYLAIDSQFPMDSLRSKWNHLHLEPSPVHIDFPFQGDAHLPFIRIFLRTLCSFKHPHSSQHWVFSLFALSYVHQFAVNHPGQSAFTAEMISEIFFNGHFPGLQDHAIIAKAYFNFESERMIKIPDLSLIKSIFCLDATPLNPAMIAMISKIVQRLLQNGCIGALNEASSVLDFFGSHIPPEEKTALEQQLNDLLAAEIPALLETPEHFVAFVERYPRLLTRIKDRLEQVVGDSKINAIKGLLLFITRDARSLPPSEAQNPLDHFHRIRGNLQEMVVNPELTDFQIELREAVCAYVDELNILMDDFYRSFKSSVLLPFCTPLIEEATNALTTLELHRISPEDYRILWHKLLLLHLRKLVHDETPNGRPLLEFYKATHPGAFAEVDHAQITRYARMLRDICDTLPEPLLDMHDAFFVCAGYYSPVHFDEIISTLQEPDDRLFEGICTLEPLPAKYSLKLCAHVLVAKNPNLDAWILQKAPSDWFLRSDEIGSTLRALLKRLPQELYIAQLSGLLRMEEPPLQASQLLELLSPERIYPNALLELLMGILGSIQLTAQQKESFLAIFFHQDLQFFPWEWTLNKNHLQRIAQKLLKSDYLPLSLQQKLQNDPQLGDRFVPFLVGSPHPQHLPLFQPWIARSLANKKFRPDFAYLEKLIGQLIQADPSNGVCLQQAASLLLHPALRSMPHLKELFGSLIDRSLHHLLENSAEFAERANLFKEMADEFPHSRYCEDPSLTKGFAVKPRSTLSYKSLFQAAHAVLLHYLRLEYFFDLEKVQGMEMRLNLIEETAPDVGIDLSFEPQTQGDLHWLLIEKLMHYPAANDAQRCLLALFARVHLHQYALNHRKDMKKMLVANEQIFFMSAFDNRGAFWLEQLAYSMFADEKRFQQTDRAQRHFVRNLIEARVELLHRHQSTHTKQLHDLFMNLIRAGTPASLEVAERLRCELTFNFHEPYWNEENQETTNQFKQRILPLLEREENFEDFYRNKRYLLKYTFAHLRSEPQAFNPGVRSKLLTLVSRPEGDTITGETSFSDLQLSFLITLWEANPEISADERMITALLSGAERLCKTFSQDKQSVEQSKFNCLSTVLHRSPLHTLSPDLYRKLWQTTHDYFFKKALGSTERGRIAWITRLSYHLAHTHRDVILNTEDSLRPYLEKTREQIATTPAWNSYLERLNQFLS